MNKISKILLLIVVIAVAAIAVVAFVMAGRDQEPPIQEGGMLIPGYLTEEQRQGDVPQEEGQLHISMNTNLVVNQEGEIPLKLVNAFKNSYPMEIVITDQTGETLYYQSPRLEPGEAIDEATLQEVPNQAGTYDVKVTFTYYSGNTDTVVGTLNAIAQLIVS